MNIKLTKNFTFHKNFIIWKVLAEQNGSRVVLELRDETEREVVFACIDILSLKVLWDDLAFEEDWWISVSEVVAGKAYFFQYSDNQVPEPEGIIAVDITKKGICWYVSEYQLEKAYQEFIRGFKFTGEEKEEVLISSDNGEIRPFKGGELGELGSSVQQPVLPVRYLENTAYFETVSNFIKAKTGVEPVRIIDYFEHKGYILISFYHKNVKSFENKLIIFDVNGNIMWEDVIDMEVKGIGLEPFFIWQDNLIWIKDKRELCVISLKE